jgi:anti-anti-sigma factor
MERGNAIEPADACAADVHRVADRTVNHPVCRRAESQWRCWSGVERVMVGDGVAAEERGGGAAVHGDVDQQPVTVEDVGDDGVVIAAVHGDFDVDSFRDVREALFTCLNGRASALVVDLGDVGFFGSMGIAVLVEARQRADVVGAGFAVVAGRRTVARPIRMTDTEDLLRLHRTQDEALASVRARSGQETDTGFSWWSS